MGTAERINASQRTLPYVEIMDSTLRDGEQTNGVSFLPHEKLMMARMLLGEVNVDRIEVASARVSEGEKEAVRMICRYAEQIGKLDRVEVLGFVDGKACRYPRDGGLCRAKASRCQSLSGGLEQWYEGLS